MTEYNQVRWVSYPITIDGNVHIRYGLFDVHFINDAPAHAQRAKITGLVKAGNAFLKQVQAIQRACQEHILICSNSVNYDRLQEEKRLWDGSLIFDHPPILH